MASTNDAMRQITEQGRESGELMTEIAKDTREDSYAMKSIAILTMFYLPGAFVTVCFFLCDAAAILKGHHRSRYLGCNL